MTIKRYGLAIRYANSVGVPDMVEMPEGDFVRHADFNACIAHNEMLVAKAKAEHNRAIRKAIDIVRFHQIKPEDTAIDVVRDIAEMLAGEI